jgi:hypothetical protein
VGCTAAPTVRTVALTAPGGDQPAFEPHLALDPANPDRILVGAHYGVGYNRGGRRIWHWRSDDAGRTWTGADVPLPSADADLAADAVTAFGPAGAGYLLFVFAKSPEFRGGAALARTDPTTGVLGAARLVAADRWDEKLGAVDKPWLAVDGGQESSQRGTVYLTWHLNMPQPDRTVTSTLWIASSRDGGQTFTEPIKVADHFSGQIAVRHDGTVELVFGDREDRFMFHASSRDGGRSWSPPDTITVMPDDRAFDIPAILTTGGDSVVVCWAEGPRAVGDRRKIQCSRSSRDHDWSEPAPLVPDLPGTSSVSYPSLAVNRQGVWVLAYRADADTTAVVLYRSTDGGRTFTVHRVLGSRPFGLARFCPSPGGDCRRAPADSVFFMGDYAGLAASDDRLAAAYVLPRGAGVGERPTVYVSILEH